jgi:hypothetical protein
VGFFVLFAAIIGTPVDTRAALFVILAVIAVGIHASLGTLIGGRVGERGVGTLPGRLADHIRVVAFSTLAGVVVLGVGFWYLVFVFTTIQLWLIVVAALAFVAGFLVEHRAARLRRFGAPPKPRRLRRGLTYLFAPTAGLAGVIFGLFVAAALLLGSAVVDTTASQSAPKIVPLPKVGSDAGYGDYVALGDSYSAGEGLGPTGDCHQSREAFGRLLAAKEGWQVDFEACSGAVVGDVFGTVFHGPQVRGEIDPNVGLVTLTIGGNDALFSKVVVSCIEHPSCMWGKFPPSNVAEEQPVLGGRPAPLEHVWAPATILAIGEQLGSPGGLFARLRAHFPNARIVAVGYPYLLPDGHAPLARDLMCANILRRVDEPDRAEIRYLQDRFNDTIFEEAVRQGVDYISPRVLWAGHEPCGKHGQWTNSIQAFLNPFNPIGGGAFHPNSAGQHAFAALVSCYLANNKIRPAAQQFEVPADWLTPPTALKLLDGKPFPHQWGTSSNDFNGCGFP